MKKKLTDKQKQFCQEYIIDLNATQAAIRAGYSEKTARAIASENLSKLYIQEEIQKAMNARSKRTEITADMVARELARLGFSDISNYVEWGKNNYKLKESVDLTKDQTASISEVSVHKSKDGGSIKFKLHDKGRSLEMLARHLGMFTEKHEFLNDLVIQVRVKNFEEATDDLPGKE